MLTMPLIFMYVTYGRSQLFDKLRQTGGSGDEFFR